MITPRTFRSGEAAHLEDHHAQHREPELRRLQTECRGLFPQEIRTRAYRIARYRPGGARCIVDGRRSPATRGTSRSRSDYALTKLELPGVYVVKVTDEKTLQATTLVIGSDLDAIVKTSQDQILIFAQDMKTGQGRAGARVLVADGGSVVLEGRHRGRRRLAPRLEARAAGNGRLSYLILDGPHVAGSGLGVPAQVAQGLTSARLHLHRPTGLSARPEGLPPRRRPRGRRTASTPTCRSRSTASKSPTAAAG